MQERPETPAQGEHTDMVVVDGKASDPIATTSTLESQRLSPGVITQLLEWAWNGIVTLLPLFFIVLSIIALRLNGEPTSKYGTTVLKVTRLSPTIYPILFVMVTARFYKSLARWSLERPRGIRLCALEQISGSQSFASAIERFFTVPISIESNVEATNSTFYYGYTDLQSSSYIGANAWSTERSMVTSIYTTVLLSDTKSKCAWSDPWQNLRIPMLPRTESNNMNGLWRQVNSTALALGHDTYASLVGLKVQGLHFGDRTTKYDFNVSSSYVEFTCSQARIFSSRDEADNFLSDTEFNLTARLNHSEDGGRNSAIKISLHNNATGRFFGTNAVDHVPPLHLSYIARSG
ncbi:hypothetical protein CMUS01_15383 [Colletotrichum musicola]|uniref:Uncharacterized protein n=1 Tax=Colletotrichum musicola TaxID=2175873 RepID=A0A8H6IXA0_9PEZI|nr:hypothetical protein CMUS01_15383 [Colletotrichum musicola]